MLLFHKKDLLVVLTMSNSTVEFSKPIKDILKYQHRYNYKFKLYETGKVTVADDYVIEGETLTVFFGSAYVEYSSSGATYNDGGSGGEGDEGGCECVIIARRTSRGWTTDKTVNDVYNNSKYTHIQIPNSYDGYDFYNIISTEFDDPYYIVNIGVPVYGEGEISYTQLALYFDSLESPFDYVSIV